MYKGLTRVWQRYDAIGLKQTKRTYTTCSDGAKIKYNAIYLMVNKKCKL